MNELLAKTLAYLFLYSVMAITGAVLIHEEEMDFDSPANRKWMLVLYTIAVALIVA